MCFISKFLIKMTATKVGKDAFGHTYYQGKGSFIFKRPRRFIIYNNNNADPSFVSTAWFRWLHYQTDSVPQSNQPKYFWEEEYKGNKSGTNMSYSPMMKLNETENNDRVVKERASYYKAWKA